MDLRAESRPPGRRSFRIVLFPLALVVALAPIPQASVLTRVLMMLAVVPLGLATWRRLHRVEVTWMGLCAAYFAGVLVSAVLALLPGDLPSDFEAYIQMDLGKQGFMLLWAIWLVVALRTPQARRLSSFGLGLAGIAFAAIIINVYVAFTGFSLPSIDQLKDFKYFAVDVMGIATNPLSFAMLLAFAVGLPWWSERKWLQFVFVGIGLLGVALSASRTTQLSLIAAPVLVRLWRTASRLPSSIRVIAYPTVIAVALASILLFDLIPALDPYELSRLTTGRFDLWLAALTKFAMHPLAGWGAGTWKLNLATFMTDYTEYGADAFLDGLESGGFHNAYLTILAERGLVVFVPGILMLAALARWSAALYRHRWRLEGTDARFAALAPIIVLLIVVRGMGEQAGLFGTADGLVDFIAYLCAGQIAALYATLQRLLRREYQHGAPSLVVVPPHESRESEAPKSPVPAHVSLPAFRPEW